MPPLRPTIDEPSPFSAACGLAEIVVMFAAKHGAELVPALLEKADRDRWSLMQAAKELEVGGAHDLAKMVKAAAKAAKLKEPAWRTADRKTELERHRAMVRAHRKSIGRDPDAPIKPGKRV